jgi:hypothetical protein
MAEAMERFKAGLPEGDGADAMDEGEAPSGKEKKAKKKDKRKSQDKDQVCGDHLLRRACCTSLCYATFSATLVSACIRFHWNLSLARCAGRGW